MCAVSNIGDQYAGQWPGAAGGAALFGLFPQGPTKQEFEDLKREVLQMKELLKKAKAQDEAEGNKDCEMEEKLKILRAVAEAVGVSLDDVFGPKKA